MDKYSKQAAISSSGVSENHIFTGMKCYWGKTRISKCIYRCPMLKQTHMTKLTMIDQSSTFGYSNSNMIKQVSLAITGGRKWHKMCTTMMSASKYIYICGFSCDNIFVLHLYRIRSSIIIYELYTHTHTHSVSIYIYIIYNYLCAEVTHICAFVYDIYSVASHSMT